MDLMERLCETVNRIPNLPIPCKMGYWGVEESFVVFPLPGSRVVQTFMDGTSEHALNYGFAMKSKQQNKIHATLWIVQNGLEAMGNDDIVSKDNSFEFEDLVVTIKPFINQLDEQGWFVFLLDVKANVIIPNKEGK